MEYKPEMLDRVHKQALIDIRIMSDGIEETSSAAALVSFHSKTRFMSANDISETALSVGCTAHLCSYRVSGGEWQYDYAKRGSIRADQIIDGLDCVSYSIAEKTGYLKFHDRHKSNDLFKSVALMSLALGAVRDDEVGIFMRVAGMMNARNHQIAAQEICSNHFATHDTARKNVRLTADPSKASFITPKIRIEGVSA